MPSSSLKNSICIALTSAIKSEPFIANKELRVFFLTPAGLISGIPINSENTKGDAHIAILDITSRVCSKEALENGLAKNSEDEFILLSDVEIRPIENLKSVLRVKTFILFTSSVIGTFCGEAISDQIKI